ncbi:ABC transporter substrate-binding protein [Desulfolucanica intricata]|uniref:ABC transporter substrate-binding protein n=1 Tax=Desulfolucanica intricata TaxID=1285191 RepID=UPI00082DB366|nr:ABC transporter substrate-binding protein [Desulfolucanica intricata]
MLKNSKLFLLITAIAILSLVVVGCGQSENTGSSSTDETIKIGFLGAKNGNHASFGIETLKGIKMAAEDINAEGGVLGKKIEIVEGDHGSKTSEGSTVTQKLINKDKVVAIVGDPTTGITKVAANIAQGSKTVLLSAGAVGTGVVEIGDYIYRDTLPDAIAAPAVMKYCKEELGWDKVALVYSKNNDYSVGLADIFRNAMKEQGVEIVAEQTIQDGDQNFAAQVTALKPHAPKGIVFTGYYTEGGLFMKEIRKQGMDIVMVGGDGLLSSKLWELGGKAVEGSMVYAGFAVDENSASDKTKAFIEKYKANNNGKLPDMFSVQGYDAVMLLADAMKNANSADPTVFKDYLAKTKNWEGVSGTITFREDRECIKNPVYLQEVKNQNWTVKAAIPATE